MSDRERLIEEIAEHNYTIALAMIRRGMGPTDDLHLTMQQLRLLLLVVANAPVRAHEISGLLHVSKATVSALVERLVDSGHIERKVDADDRRVRLLSPTARGELAARRVMSFATDQHREIIERLTGAELQAILASTKGIRRVLEELEG